MKILWISFAVVFGSLCLLGAACVWTALVYYFRDNRIGRKIARLMGYYK